LRWAVSEETIGDMVTTAGKTLEPADDCLADQARSVLEPRLKSVARFLARAARQRPRDVEHVHKLRVASRRALAALSVFEAILPEKRARWWRKRIKQVRRAAGEARDQDVLIGLLKKRAREQPDDAWQSLIDEVARSRKRAQRPIDELHDRLTRKKLDHRRKKLIERICRAERTGSLSAAACEHLRPLVSEMLGEDRERLDDDAALHRLRIRAKRLRYSLEIFAEAWDEDRRPLFAGIQQTIEKMQKMLGDHNDHVSIVKRLEPWRDELGDSRPAKLLEELAADQRAAAVEGRRQFLTWWTADERSRLERELEKLLGCE
jgi:CHAD domain-containing protein